MTKVKGKLEKAGQEKGGDEQEQRKEYTVLTNATMGCWRGHVGRIRRQSMSARVTTDRPTASPRFTMTEYRRKRVGTERTEARTQCSATNFRKERDCESGTDSTHVTATRQPRTHTPAHTHTHTHTVATDCIINASLRFLTAPRDRWGWRKLGGGGNVKTVIQGLETNSQHLGRLTVTQIHYFSLVKLRPLKLSSTATLSTGIKLDETKHTQKVAGSNLGQSASRQQPLASC